MLTMKRRRPREPASIEERLAEQHQPPKKHLVTRITEMMIQATRWQDDRGRWLYVDEVPGSGNDRMPALFGVFLEGEDDAVEIERIESVSGPCFFSVSSFEFVQQALDCAGQRNGWTPDPPPVKDDDEAAPVRSASAKGQEPLGEGSSPSALLVEPTSVCTLSREDLSMTTKTKRRPGGAKRAGKSVPAEAPAEEAGGSPIFAHGRSGIVAAAEKWLAAQGVPDNHHPAWTLVLPERTDSPRRRRGTTEVSISLHDWRLLVDQLLRPWLAAGWMLASPGEEYTLAGAVGGIRLGVSLDIFSLSLHEAQENDPTFRSAVSSTGFRNLGDVDASRITPAGLSHYFEQHAAEWRDACQPKSQGRSPKPGGKPRAAARKPTPDPRPPSPASRPSAPASTALVPVPATAGPLSKAEKHDLAKLEAVIRKGVESFTAVGNALTEIQARRLYRQEFATFEDYCRRVWNFGRAEAFDKIAAARIAGVVSPISDKANVPLREDHLKALAPLGDPADIRAVYDAVVKRCKKADEPVTGKLLREERRRYTTPGDELEREAEKRGMGDGGRGMGDGGRGSVDAEKGRRGEKEPEAPRPDAAAVPLLPRNEQVRWNRALAELAEMVHHLAQQWPHCRLLLAREVYAWAEQLEAEPA